MQISDEAVKAAAIALYERKHIEGVGLADVRHALDAAAPYIISEHLLTLAEDTRARGDIGKEDGREAWDYLTFHAEKARTNPYRSQGVAKVEAMDDALRMYVEGVALAEITERTGISYSGLMKAKKDRGIPSRPQRADGTDRSQA